VGGLAHFSINFPIAVLTRQAAQPIPKGPMKFRSFLFFFLVAQLPNFSLERQTILQAISTCNFLALVLVMTV